jgi:[protein-PII] uridylyltransferase
VAGLGEAGDRGLLPEREVHSARAARDFLWRLRNELHISTGRRDDRLTFDNQKRLAEALGYRDGAHELGVERLMSETYTALQEIARAADALIDRCAAEDAPPPRVPLGLRGLFSAGLGIFGRRAPHARPIDAAFQLWQGRVTVVDDQVFRRRPADLVRLFSVAEAYDLPVFSQARALLVQELHRSAAALAGDQEAQFELWQLLTRDGSVGAQLVPMHELGVLGALVPELQRLRGRVQHSAYHVYTVDTHTVFALQRLCRLRAGALAESEPELTRVARALVRPLPLMLGLLFHDLGKGMGGDHSRRGAELLRGYAARAGLEPGDAADAEWLVLEHLSMSLISQRRDLEDERLIAEFARSCGTVERLEMMVLLTYADMASVSAENWTSWKAGLLQTLYQRARAALLAGGGGEEQREEQRIEARREQFALRLRALLQAGGRGAEEAATLAGELAHAAPERYLATVRPVDAARHAGLWVEARKRGFASELWLPQSGEAELTLVAGDRPGLLALFAAALAASGVDILTAEAHTLAGGVALDRFVVREPGGGPPAPGRWENVQQDLQRLLAGQEDPVRLVERRLRRGAFGAVQPAVKTKVRSDNVSSARFTVLDVAAQDRPGLLYSIAEALHLAGASIELARVATEGNRATDAFYLSDGRAGGGKLAGPRLQEVESAVRAAIG